MVHVTSPQAYRKWKYATVYDEKHNYEYTEHNFK